MANSIYRDTPVDGDLNDESLISGLNNATTLNENEFFEQNLDPIASAQLLYYNGSSWISKPLKTYVGGSFQVKPLKIWNGSSWITVT